MKGRKHDKPLKLDLPFDEALRRFLRTDPDEVAESIATDKEKREPLAKRPPSLEGEKPLN